MQIRLASNLISGRNPTNFNICKGSVTTTFADVTENHKKINKCSPHFTTIQVSPRDVAIQVSLADVRCHRIIVL